MLLLDRALAGPRRLVLLTALLVPTLVAAPGCGSGRSVPTGLVDVTGTVTLDGQPLEGAVLSFIPQSSNTSESSVNPGGVTDAQGNYQLMVDDVPGALPGEYKVVITRLATPDGKAVQPSKDKSFMDLMLQGAKESLPKTYSDSIATTLKASVSASGGKVDFPLKRGPAGK